ncbi:MAG: MGH1-like glycoside hydrolase domain-containing protein, partial [Actinomycetota bacterium]
RSLVGLLPITATTTLGKDTLDRLPAFAADLDWFALHRPEYAQSVCFRHDRDGGTGQLLSLVAPENLTRILTRLLDEDEFLSPFGVRSLSRAHAEKPFVLELPGVRAEVGYEPGESRTGVFGGNSNWRGPIWVPANVMLVQSLRRFARLFGDDIQLEVPTGSGRHMGLAQAAEVLTDRMAAPFLPGPDGRRPVLGDSPLFARPEWSGNILFHEYLHGETGEGLGAAHQTGWTALVADLLLHRGTPVDGG